MASNTSIFADIWPLIFKAVNHKKLDIIGSDANHVRKLN